MGSEGRPGTRRGARWRRGIPSGLLALTCLLGGRHGLASDRHPTPDGPGDASDVGRVVTTVERAGEAYVVSASGVLPVEPGRLLSASIDFERYEALGLPGLRASRIVSVSGPDALYTWSWITWMGQSSKHYLAVEIARDRDLPGAAAVRWHLARREPGWPYEDAPAFARLDGSWSQEPLADGTVSVRYQLVAVPAAEVPDRLVGWLIRRQLETGARQLVHGLARAAARAR